LPEAFETKDFDVIASGFEFTEALRVGQFKLSVEQKNKNKAVQMLLRSSPATSIFSTVKQDCHCKRLAA
jgi:hypothetical protein